MNSEMDESICNVFLDTHAFEANQFDFTSKAFELLIELVESDHIRIFMPDVVHREIVDHLQKRAAKTLDKLQELKALANPGLGIAEPELAFLKAKVDSEKIAKAYIQGFERFMKSARVLRLGHDAINANALLNMHFSGTPPFGLGNKQSEFRDALARLALDKVCDDLNCKMHVVTQDGDWKQTCEKVPSFVRIDTLRDLLARFTDPRLAKALLIALKGDAEFMKYACDQFERVPFHAADPGSEVVRLRHGDLKIEYARILDAKNGEGTAYVEFAFEFDADVVTHFTRETPGRRHVVYAAQQTNELVEGNGNIGADVFLRG